MRTTLVTDYLEKTAERFHDKIAFANDNFSMTFGELRNISKRIATVLAECHFFKQPVAVFLDKSPNCIAAFMGAAYSGNFYSPIDVNMPVSRVEKILHTLQPVAIITDEKHKVQVEKFADDCTKILVFEELREKSINENLLINTRKKIIDTDILYILFTSGSTGTPKGVIISHSSVVDYTEWVSNKFDINDRHILGNQAPLYFDLSVQDVYCPLKTGATTYLIDEKEFVFPIKLMKILANKGVNVIFWVPTALCMIANLKALKGNILPPLEKVLFCGEVMPNKQLNKWRSSYPNAEFVNLYGPTEVTEVCTYFPIKRQFADEDSLPIGFPCENLEIFVLNESDELVKDNEIGELCVRGTCLSHGYYKNPEKTAEVFVQNPLNNAYPEIIYRTGDLVKYNEYGELIYICRKDFQIKHMGHRIELGEIETAVSSLPEIHANVCLYDDKKNRIVLFYTGNIEEKSLGEQLHKLLPEYMLPNKRCRLKIMPLNLNGKIDRQELKKLL